MEGCLGMTAALHNVHITIQKILGKYKESPKKTQSSSFTVAQADILNLIPKQLWFSISVSQMQKSKQEK